MSKRLVSKKILPNGTGYKVYRSYHTGEWITEFYLRGVKHNGASYFTDSMEDAMDTGEYWLRERDQRGERHAEYEWARSFPEAQDSGRQS